MIVTDKRCSFSRPQPSEANGIESALAGLRDTIADDDQLQSLASIIFDGLLASFEKGPK